MRRCSAVVARTSASRESRPAAARRRAIDEAMPYRAEREERADVARRLYGESYVEDDLGDFDSFDDED